MLRSGFGGFNNLSSATNGKTTAVDSFRSLSRAIKTILNDENVIIYTTAVASTINIASGLVHKWTPLDYVSSSLFLSQSTNTSKPTLNSANGLGKYPSIYCASTNNLVATDAPNIFKKITNFFTYYNWVTYPSTLTTAYLFRVYNTSYYSVSQFPGVYYNNGSSNLQTRYSNTFNGSNKAIFLAFNKTNASTIFGSNTNTFRVLEQIYDSTNMAVTSSFYDQDKNVINVTSNSSGLLASANKYSFTFTSASVGVSSANWNLSFPQNSFMPYTASIGSTAGDPVIAYHTYIQSSTDSTISVAAVQNLKNLLDQVYGA